MVIPIRGDFFAVSHLSWRPLLSVPYHRIPCTAQDRFCGRAALAALPRDSQCHCMPDIFAQSELRMAFSSESLRPPQLAASFMSGLGVMFLPVEQPVRRSLRSFL